MGKILTPNRITLLRVMIAGAAVALYGSRARVHAIEIGGAAIALTLIAVLLDGVDGFVARRFQLATPFGAQLDILGDRVLENLFFTVFAVAGLVSLWVPVTFFVRGAVTDFLRGLASGRELVSERGGSAFRRDWFLENRWSKAIVASRFSRAAYGAAKCACFCVLGSEWIARRTAGFSTQRMHELRFVSAGVVGITIAFCVLRAIPVIAEGWKDVLRAARIPANAKTSTERADLAGRGSMSLSLRGVAGRGAMW